MYIVKFSDPYVFHNNTVQEMIFGALIPLGIQTVRIGYKGVTWCTVPTTACGWGISFTRIGTCSSPLTLVPSSMRPLEPSPVDPFTLAIASESTTSSCSKASFCQMGLSCVVNIMHSPQETACLKTPYMTAKQCSKSGISTK